MGGGHVASTHGGRDEPVPETAALICATSPDASAQPARPAAPPRPTRATKVAGLDGVRGVAALFVVVHHVFLRGYPGYPVDHAPVWAAWFIYGRFAVVAFIVLSGFSLALGPAAAGWRLDGVARFAHRRARRILPAYWAALVLSLVVAWLVAPPPGQAAPGVRTVLVDGLLLQNLVAAPSPNRAFWSVAMELQLYVLFPLLLLLVRRVNAAAMVASVALGVGAFELVAPRFAWTRNVLVQSPPELAALFATGVLAAGIVPASQHRRDMPWHWFALGAAAPVLAVVADRGSVWTVAHLAWVDLALGPALGCLLAALATGRPVALVHALGTRPLRVLGSCSYSLYLTHMPIVVLVYGTFVAGRFRPGTPAFLAAVVLVVPAAVLFARLFAAVFERPFVRRRGLGAVRGLLPAPRDGSAC